MNWVKVFLRVSSILFIAQFASAGDTKEFASTISDKSLESFAFQALSTIKNSDFDQYLKLVHPACVAQSDRKKLERNFLSNHRVFKKKILKSGSCGLSKLRTKRFREV